MYSQKLLKLAQTLIDKTLIYVGQNFLGDDTYFWSAPIIKDTFIHFTPKKLADKIIEEGYLGHDGYTTFGVSTYYGKFYPNVQTTHIVDPETGRKTQEIVAISFKTSDFPYAGFVEEVNWYGKVKLDKAEKLTKEEAISRINNNSVANKLGNGKDFVILYDPEDAFEVLNESSEQLSSEEVDVEFILNSLTNIPARSIKKERFI